MVNLLAKIEQSFERLMEGTTGSIFNQAIQPAEIGKKLERIMLSRQQASMGATFVPNVYKVGLHPKDFAPFSEVKGGLARQMEAWLGQVAAQRNLSMFDRVQITIDEDETARRRVPSIIASFSDTRSQTPARPERPMNSAQSTAAFRPEPRPRGVTASLRTIDGPERGRSYIVPPGDTTVGRSPENDIVLDRPDVSRRHARLTCDRHGVRVEDLNSTNGTRLNGDPVRVADLSHGDELTFGGVRTTVTLHREGGNR